MQGYKHTDTYDSMIGRSNKLTNLFSIMILITIFCALCLLALYILKVSDPIYVAVCCVMIFFVCFDFIIGLLASYYSKKAESLESFTTNNCNKQ